MDSPIITATFQAACLSALSNVLGQLITYYQTTAPFILNTASLFQFVLFSILSCPPNFLWQAWLEAQFPGSTAASNESMNSEKKSEKEGIDVSSSRQSSSKKDDSKTLNVKNTAIKFALDQTLGSIVNTIMFIAGMGLIRGESLGQIQHDVYEGFVPLILAGGKLWPIVSVVSFTLVPVEQRMVFSSLVGVGWGVFLSLVASAES